MEVAVSRLLCVSMMALVALIFSTTAKANTALNAQTLCETPAGLGVLAEAPRAACERVDHGRFLLTYLTRWGDYRQPCRLMELWLGRSTAGEDRCEALLKSELRAKRRQRGPNDLLGPAPLNYWEQQAHNERVAEQERDAERRYWRQTAENVAWVGTAILLFARHIVPPFLFHLSRLAGVGSALLLLPTVWTLFTYELGHTDGAPSGVGIILPILWGLALLLLGVAALLVWVASRPQQEFIPWMDWWGLLRKVLKR